MSLEKTGNFKFEIPDPNSRPWYETWRRNWRLVDATMAMLFTISDFVGVWENSTVYTAGEVALDEQSGVLYRCANTHTSAGGAITFQQHRADNPTHWAPYASSVTFRQLWTTATLYEKGDVVVSNDTLAVAAVGHTSTGTFTNDVAGGKWTVLIDFGSVQAASEAALAAALAAAATIPAPTAANNYIRVKSSLDGYEHRTIAELRTEIGLSTYGLSLVDDADAGAAQTTLGMSTFFKTLLSAASASALRTLAELVIGTNVQAFDANTLKANVADQLEAGFNHAIHDLGDITTGTVTPDFDDGNVQEYVNGGAHTLAPPAAGNGAVWVQVTNNASAGAVTTSGFTTVSGDSLSTTNGDDFLLYIAKIATFTHLHVTAMQ